MLKKYRSKSGYNSAKLKKAELTENAGLLDKINSPADIKGFNNSELEVLAFEIRKFLIESISKTGGHLAPNLGVVELTIAIHKIFNSPDDKIVWDVGHQSYVHKILTGRKEKFDTLRKYGGISGFTKRSESVHDIFGAGHSSTSVSAAAGIAAADRLIGNGNYTIAVIGDGSLTGGIAYEALNNSAGKKNLIVVLNDNGMSISKNVGAVSKYLAKLRTTRGYYKFKRRAENVMSHIPLINKPLISIIKRIKKILRYALYQSTFFEHLGFDFLGPVDGHNIENLSAVFEEAKKRNKPVLVHVKTQKGRGYEKAESQSIRYHSVGSFDLDCGVEDSELSDSFSSVFGDKIVEIAQNNDKIIAVTAAMTEGTKLDKFKKNFRDRFFDVGIAESHAAIFSAAFSVMDFIPVFVCYSSFLQRSYDQIIHDVAMQNLHVIFCIDRAGLVGDDGPTHHGVFDVAFLYHIPNVTIYSPAVYGQLENVMDIAVNEINSPVFIRYPKGSEDLWLKQKLSGLSVNGDYAASVEMSAETVIISYGRIAKEAFKLYETLKSCKIIILLKIKPMDISKIYTETGANCKNIIFIEEGVENGGVSQFLSNKLQQMYTQKINIHIYSLGNDFIQQGDIETLFALTGISAEKIAEQYIRDGRGESL